MGEKKKSHTSYARGTGSEFDVTAVVKALYRECDKAVEEVDAAIAEAGKTALNYLLENSPVDTSKYGKLHVISKGPRKGEVVGSSGLYRAGWRMKTYRENGAKCVKVYNSTCWQLTHLLEDGHLNRDLATYTPAHKHIKKAEDKAYEKLEELLK